MRKNRTHLKVKVIEGTLAVGVFTGSVCVGILMQSRVSSLKMAPFLKDILGRACIAGGIELGLDLAGKAVEWFRETDIYLNAKREEEFFAKAEANGWTLVKCNYTVEDWEKAVA